MSSSKEFSVLSRNSFKSGIAVSFFLHLVKSCAMLSTVPPAPRQAVPPHVFLGGERFFLPPICMREGVARMNVTWSDLFQFCILIVAVLAYAESKKK